MIAAALEAEVDEYVQRFPDELDSEGRRLVVRNRRGKERRVTVGSGTLPIRAPRVSDERVDEETGERVGFSSQILPHYARRSRRVTDVLPVLYLRLLSSGDFAPALKELLGEDASGLSAPSIQRLTEQWREEHRAFKQPVGVRSLPLPVLRRGARRCAPGRGQAPVRAGDHRGARGRSQGAVGGRGRLPRESSDSWAEVVRDHEVLRDLKARGMSEPKLVTGDGRSGYGARYATCSRARERSAAGCTRQRMSSMRCPSGRTRWPNGRHRAGPDAQGRRPGDR